MKNTSFKLAFCVALVLIILLTWGIMYEGSIITQQRAVIRTLFSGSVFTDKIEPPYSRIPPDVVMEGMIVLFILTIVGVAAIDARKRKRTDVHE